jgi:hypothetical protein
VFGWFCVVSDRFALTGTSNAYLVKRKTGGAPQFSRDPLNLTNVHARKVRFEVFKAGEFRLANMVTVRRFRQ